MKVSAILAAAGEGRRLKNTSAQRIGLPKAFWPLQGKPLLDYSLQALLDSKSVAEVILVLPAGFSSMPCAKEGRRKRIKIVRGGKTRALSVYNGLKCVSPKSRFVLVHDAARPMITPASIDLLARQAEKLGAVIAAKPITSTIKKGEQAKIIETVSRENLWEAQTPQIARKDWLKQAYDAYFKKPFPATDEASLLEAIGKPVKLLSLNHLNLKITTGEDFEMAQKIMNHKTEFRIGHGSDLHRLVSGRRFILGGETIQWPKGPLGHSDGDALLHAISDAILGAVGGGDIGDYFSDQSKKFKNISSLKILSHVLKLSESKGYELQNVDCIIHLEKPRLGLYKEKIRKRLSRLLNLSNDSVNIKAKTGEGFAPVGSGEAIACDATVLVQRQL